jgi:UDP-galactopyranose mutase
MSSQYDLVCLSHLRWDFVYQRPQHLLSRFARERRVFFVEEPVFGAETARMETSARPGGVVVCVPRLPDHLEANAIDAMQEQLLAQLFSEQDIHDFVLWYYTPMALGFTQHLRPQAVVYDCMDELSAFAGASPLLREREAELFRRADLVFTGGQSLYESKKDRHARIFAFPSSVDVPHFQKARTAQAEPSDQAPITHPRLGFFGVIDERLDIALLDAVAALRPDWQWVVIGPVVKIDPATLPQRGNIHYLGGKAYTELPAYLSSWDVATLPFARNESTRFISPTKTPEYLAAGCSVVSTSIADVVRPYGEQGLVHIADTPDAFVAACEAALAQDRTERLARVDAFLSEMSWDKTWSRMNSLIEDALAPDKATNARAKPSIPTATVALT